MKNVFKFLGIAFVACSMFVACDDDIETFTIKVKANDSSMGTVTGGGKYESGATATLEATANAGYKFVNWEDNSTNNPRLVTVTADAEYTANFAVQTGVKVQFGDATWNAETINGSSNSSSYMVAASQSASSDYPIALVYSSSLATGTTTGTPNVNISEGTASAGDPYMWYFESAERAMTLGGNPCGDWWADNLTVNVSAFDADAMTISLVANGTAKSLFDCLQGSTWDNTPSKAMTMTVNAASIASKAAMPTVFSGKIAKK
ncbi:MAG: hypothetical protein IKQ53_06635 [Bacteroidales bacterium]|nr:hypothetical protein [Bacteroidales bacterium]